MIINFKGADSIGIGNAIEQPSQDVVKGTVSLWQADLDTAIRYGGELTRAAIGAMNLHGDKKYIIVDTKVHMLMPGQCPAIPGWHTDGAPRLIDDKRNRLLMSDYSPLGSGPPDLTIQRGWELRNDFPRFHLLVTGTGCLTTFLRHAVTMKLPDEAKPDLYARITRKVRHLDKDLTNWESPTCTPLEWGWWHLHAAKIATKREWRFLIRVTESNHQTPQPPSNLANIIRMQQMVYSPLEFGW